MALSILVFWAADKLSRKWFNEIFYRSYEGASEDRLVVLSEELFDDVINPNIYPRARQGLACSIARFDTNSLPRALRQHDRRTTWSGRANRTNRLQRDALTK